MIHVSLIVGFSVCGLSVVAIVWIARLLDASHRGRVAEIQARSADQLTLAQVTRQRDDRGLRIAQLEEDLAIKNEAIEIYKKAAIRSGEEAIREVHEVDASDADAVIAAARARRLRSKIGADVSAAPTDSGAGSDPSTGSE